MQENEVVKANVSKIVEYDDEAEKIRAAKCRWLRCLFIVKKGH